MRVRTRAASLGSMRAIARPRPPLPPTWDWTRVDRLFGASSSDRLREASTPPPCRSVPKRPWRAGRRRAGRLTPAASPHSSCGVGGRPKGRPYDALRSCVIAPARFSIFDFRFSILGARFSIFDSRRSIFDFRFSIFDFRFSIFDFRLPITDYRLPTRRRHRESLSVFSVLSVPSVSNVRVFRAPPPFSTRRARSDRSAR